LEDLAGLVTGEAEGDMLLDLVKREKNPRNKGDVKIAFVISLLLLVTGYLLVSQAPSIYQRTYHVDEGYWTATGHYYFQKFFIEQDWSYETWQEAPFGAFSTRQPTIGKYIIGAAVYLWGEGARYKILPGYDLQPFDWQALTNVRPPVKTLLAARYIISWFSILSGIILFILARELSESWLIGLATALIFMFDPLVLLIGRFVLLDMLALFFSLLTLLIAVYMYRYIYEGKWRQAIFLSMSLGLSLGLAIGVKFNTLLVFIVCLLAGLSNMIWLYLDRRPPTNSINRNALTAIKSDLTYLFYQIRQDLRPVWWTITSLTLSVLIALAVLWSSNPFLYSHPIQNVKHMFELGQIVASYDNLPENQRLNTWGDGLKNLLSMGGRKYAIIDYWLKWPWLDVILIGLGCITCVPMIFGKRHRWSLKRNYSFFVLWGIITTIGIWYWVPFDWPRYYLPTEPIWDFLEANGLVFLGLIIRQGYQYIHRVKMVRSTT
jgi:hypothetical protein